MNSALLHSAGASSRGMGLFIFPGHARDHTKRHLAEHALSLLHGLVSYNV